MGHIHLGRLPKTRRWSAVVDLLDTGASDQDIISASAIAAERDLARAANDPVFVEAVRLLANLPGIASREPLGAGLRRLGLDVPDDPGMLDLVSAVGQRLDAGASAAGRNDFGELCARALLETFVEELGAGLPGLFDPEPGDLAVVAATFARPASFSGIARTFFGMLLSETLSYWLDRTLSARVGPEARFGNARERAAFDQALAQYCAEATRIIREFAAGWYAKNLASGDDIPRDRVTAFAAIALRKIGEELREKRRTDA